MSGPGGAPAQAPHAIVLSRRVTGVATSRALHRAGVRVHNIVLEPGSPARHSRAGTVVYRPDLDHHEAEMIAFLRDYCRGLGHRPVVLPTSDRTALTLARHPALRERCIFSETPLDALDALVSKPALYAKAEAAGIDTVPGIVSPDAARLDDWSATHPGPYFLKPYYASAAGTRPFAKNHTLADRQALLAYAALHGTAGLIIQRRLEGGDGNVYDCYGVTARDGVPFALATHRRLRQDPPGTGTTSFGEIPASPALAPRLVDLTRRLLAAAPFHGIFGIEWLHEPATDRLYLIDFNARAFLSIGHLDDCGINLPYLAYRELAGLDQLPVPAAPRHSLWMDVERDLESLSLTHGRAAALAEWLRTVMRCRHFAWQSWRDPLPGLVQAAGLARRMAAFAAGRAARRLHLPGRTRA